MGFPDITTNRTQFNLPYGQAEVIADAIESSLPYQRASVTEQYLPEPRARAMGDDERLALLTGLASNKRFDDAALADISHGLKAMPDIAGQFARLVHEARADEPDLLAAFDRATGDGGDEELPGEPAQSARAQASGERRREPVMAFLDGPVAAGLSKAATELVKKGGEKVAESQLARALPWAARIAGGGAAFATGVGEVATVGAVLYGAYQVADEFGLLPWSGETDAITGKPGQLVPALPQSDQRAGDDKPMIAELPVHPGATTSDSERRANYTWDQQHTPFHKTAEQLADPNSDLYMQPPPAQTQAQKEAQAMQPKAAHSGGDGNGRAASGGTGTVIYPRDGYGVHDPQTGYDSTPEDVIFARTGLDPAIFKYQLGNVTPLFRHIANARNEYGGDISLSGIYNNATQIDKVALIKDVKFTGKYEMPGGWRAWATDFSPVILRWNGQDFPAQRRSVALTVQAGNAYFGSDKAEIEHNKALFQGFTGVRPAFETKLVAISDAVVIDNDVQLPPVAFDVPARIGPVKAAEVLREQLMIHMPGYRMAGFHPVNMNYVDANGRVSPELLHEEADHRFTTEFNRHSFLPFTSGYRYLAYHNDQVATGHARPWVAVMTRPLEGIVDKRAPERGVTGAAIHFVVLTWEPGQPPKLAMDGIGNASSLETHPVFNKDGTPVLDKKTGAQIVAPQPWTLRNYEPTGKPAPKPMIEPPVVMAAPIEK